MQTVIIVFEQLVPINKNLDSLKSDFEAFTWKYTEKLSAVIEACVRDPAKQYPLRMTAQQFQANKTVKVNNAAQSKHSLSFSLPLLRLIAIFLFVSPIVKDVASSKLIHTQKRNQVVLHTPLKKTLPFNDPVIP